MAAGSTNPSFPPRPDAWEIPNLKDETRYFIRRPRLGASISDRLLRGLASMPNPDMGDVDPITLQSRTTMERFLRKQVNFADYDKWEPHRMLGAGGFGRAGLWVRLGQDGRIVDELVVKEQVDYFKPNIGLRYTEQGAGPYRGLLKEAVIYKQLNEYGSENVLHMRGYAFVTNRHRPVPPAIDDDIDDRQTESAAQGLKRARNQGTKRKMSPDAPLVSPIPDREVGRYRFYLEFAPYQTLQEIILKYRAWNTRLPEAFLWHVFDSLIAALQVLAKGPDRKFSSTGASSRPGRYWPRDWGVIHCDIKPENIFLGYEHWKDDRVDITGGSAILGYPIVKLADFGLASITGAGDRDNVRGNAWKTTINYQPPEHKFWGITWPNPLNHHAHPDVLTEAEMRHHELANPAFFYGNATNVWAVGKVMYDLMVLANRGDMDHWFAMADSEEDYEENGEHVLKFTERRSLPAQLAAGSPDTPDLMYTDDLINLVWACLSPAIGQRPEVDELRRQTQTFLAREERNAANLPEPTRRRHAPVRRSKRGKPLKITNSNSRVFFRGAEINEMPLGTIRYQPNIADYIQLLNRANVDNDWPHLNLPYIKWWIEVQKFRAPLPLHEHMYDVHDGRIWFHVPSDGQGQDDGGASSALDDDGGIVPTGRGSVTFGDLFPGLRSPSSSSDNHPQNLSPASQPMPSAGPQMLAGSQSRQATSPVVISLLSSQSSDDNLPEHR